MFWTTMSVLDSCGFNCLASESSAAPGVGPTDSRPRLTARNLVDADPGFSAEMVTFVILNIIAAKDCRRDGVSLFCSFKRRSALIGSMLILPVFVESALADAVARGTPIPCVKADPTN